MKKMKPSLINYLKLILNLKSRCLSVLPFFFLTFLILLCQKQLKGWKIIPDSESHTKKLRNLKTLKSTRNLKGDHCISPPARRLWRNCHIGQTLRSGNTNDHPTVSLGSNHELRENSSIYNLRNYEFKNFILSKK